MKSCFPSTICILLHLGLLNFALPVGSTCRVSGYQVYQTGDRLELTCVSTVGPWITWFFNNSSLEADHESPQDSSSTFKKDNATLMDSGVYVCQCSKHNHMLYNVFVFDATLYPVMNVARCEVAIILRVKSIDSQFSVIDFQCPTLKHGNDGVWNSSKVVNHGGYYVMRQLAIGDPGLDGKASHTCNFTIVYRPNGSPRRNFSKTVDFSGETSCSNHPQKPSGTEAQSSHTTSVTRYQGSGGSRAALCSLLLTALMLLANHWNYITSGIVAYALVSFI